MLLLILTIAFLAYAVDPNQLIVMILPLVVWLAAWFVNWAKHKLGSGGFSGTVLVTFVVPILSWGAAEIFSLLTQYQGNFWALFGLGLLGTFINEIVKQWKQTAKKVQKPAKKELVG